MRWTALLVLLLLPSRAGADVDAKTIRTWKAKCASCHGVEGKADTEQAQKMGIRPLTTVEWQRSFTDEQLRTAIRDGITRTAPDGKKQQMDPFKGKLSDADIGALAAYMRSLGPAVPATKSAETKPAGTKPAETQPAATKPAETKTAQVSPAAIKLWKSKCASCHGADGKGKKKKSEVDMTAAAWQSSHDDPTLTNLLGMPKPTVEVKGKQAKHFSGKLKPTDVESLIRVVRSFAS